MSDPAGTLQCALRQTSRDAQPRRRLWFQRLSPRPQGPGAALAAGAQAVLQQLGDVRDEVWLQPRRGSHIVVAATTNAGWHGGSRHIVAHAARSEQCLACADG